MAVWPEHRGPFVGYCPECGGILLLRWSDRITKMSICEHCGLCTTERRKRSNTNISNEINHVWTTLGRSEVNIYSFLKVLNTYLVDVGKPKISSIKRSELHFYGYELMSNKLRKRK